MLEIKTTIEQGQPYFDEPVYNKPIKLMTNLHDAMAEIHGHIAMIPTTLHGQPFMQRVRTDLPACILMGYNRTWLNWVKPS